MAANFCHHHCCQKPCIADSMYCIDHQYCSFRTCFNRIEQGSFYCREHQGVVRMSSIEPERAEPKRVELNGIIIQEELEPIKPQSGSVNILLDYQESAIKYWKTKAQYWQKMYRDSRK